MDTGTAEDLDMDFCVVDPILFISGPDHFSVNFRYGPRIRANF